MIRMHAERLGFEFDPRYRKLLSLLGITPARAWIEIAGGGFEARFGLWRLRTAVANISSMKESGPYTALRAIGPHISLADQGLTFDSTTRGGVCMLFHRPVPGRETLGLVKHPGLTVTVANPGGLMAAIDWARASSEDAAGSAEPA